MNELRDLYQEVILDHYRHPRNFGPLPAASHHAEGHNPVCGDRLTLFLSRSKLTKPPGSVRERKFLHSRSISMTFQTIRSKTSRS